MSKFSSKLARIINFDAPPIDSWNPVKRHKQHKALQQWVDTRAPSAGITKEEVSRQYPEDRKSKSRQRKGALLGGAVGVGVAGLAAGIGAATGRKGDRVGRAVAAGVMTGVGSVPVGAAVGSVLADFKKIKRDVKNHEKAYKYLVSELTGSKAVDASSLKSDTPRATKYGEVTGELKNQGVGPVTRHAAAIQTRTAVWAGDNAYFIPKGDKGLIVTSGKVHPTVFRHESGHGKDYRHYGGEKGFKKVYPNYGNPLIPREDIISNTMLAEHRAWAHAKPRSKEDKKLRDAALTTYKHGLGLSAKLDQVISFNLLEKHGAGIEKALLEIARRNKLRGAGVVIKRKPIGSVYNKAEERLANKLKPGRLFPQRMSARLDSIIAFGDPRPRNPLGEFSGSDDGVPDPNTMVKTYGQNLAGGAVAGIGAGTTGFAVKSLLEKIRKSRKKL